MLISPLKIFQWKKNLCFRNTQSAQMSIRQSIIHIYIYIYIYIYIFIYIIYNIYTFIFNIYIHYVKESVEDS